MTLTQTAFYTRLAIKYGALLLVLLIFGKIALGVGVNLYQRVFPPPPAPPTVTFGKLPVLYFPENFGSRQYTYVLQTPTGELPKFPTITNVYFMPPKSASFSGLDEAAKMAQSLGFSGSVTELSETIYRFERKDTPSTFDINIVNRTFSINYNLDKAPDLINLHPKSNEEAVNAIKYLLNPASLLPPELESGAKTFEYLKVDTKNFSETLSLSEANFVRVNLFRKNLGDMAVLTPNRKRSTVWFLVSGDPSSYRQVIAGEYHYFPIDEKQFSTYPIKTAQQAWDGLTAGKAYFSQEPNGKPSQITIRRVYLAYYDSGTPQGFLQPIVVFEGDGGFSAYIPAVTGDYYGSIPSPQASPSTQPTQ